MTFAEAGEVLGFGESTIKKLVHKGWLESCVPPGLGRTRRITRKMIDDYIARCNGQSARS